MTIKPEILIVGGTGFIGSYVTKTLNDKGYTVAVIHRKPVNPNKIFKGVLYQRGFKKKYQDYANIKTVIIAPRPDPTTFAEILDYLSKLPKLEKIVYLSTFGLYPDSLKKQKETAPIVAVTEYQKSKYYEEIALGQFTERMKIKFCIARISNPYGDVQNKEMINKLIQQLLHKTGLTLNGDGTQKRDYIFIEDAAELISFLAVRNQKKACEIFNVCSGKAYSINEIIAILENLSGKKLVFKHAPLLALEKKNSIGDNTKIIVASKYHLRYSITDGLKKTLTNYIQNHD